MAASPLPYSNMIYSRSFTPDYVDSPTYSFSSRPSQVLEKPEVLSPLPDSFYDAYSSNNSNFTCAGAMPLLTPPPSDSYQTTNSDLINCHSYEATDMLCCHPMPPPPPPSTCYSPGCSCQYAPMQSFGLMSPSMFFDPSPYSMQRKRHYNINSRGSLDSSSSSSTSSTVDSNQDKSTLTPRRYKCTLCVKRFTRPSSLATHMHSHTGEVSKIITVINCILICIF
jgi:hypothetical protein